MNRDNLAHRLLRILGLKTCTLLYAITLLICFLSSEYIIRRKEIRGFKWLKYAYGSEWCSLTYKAVKTIFEYAEVRNEFLFTTCYDEHYKQMILLSAGNFELAKEGYLRFVDFSEHKPIPCIRMVDDFDSIMSLHCCLRGSLMNGLIRR